MIRTTQSSTHDSPRNSLAFYPIVKSKRVTETNFLSSSIPADVATPINARRVTPYDVESQSQQQATDVIVGEVHDEKALGSMTLRLYSFSQYSLDASCSFFMPGITIHLEIIAIGIASVLRIRSVQTSSNGVKPPVKKWATATLVTVVFVGILRAIILVKDETTL